MFFMAAIFAYPIASVGLSMLGTWDFIDAASHLLHGRAKKLVASAFLGGVKLSFTMLVVSMITDPLFLATSNAKIKKGGSAPPPANPFDPKFEKKSELEATLSFCQAYFKSSRWGLDEIAQNCAYTILSSPVAGLKEWVNKNPLNRAAQFSKAVEEKGLSYTLGLTKTTTVISPPLKNCTAEQLAQSLLQNSSKPTELLPSKCDINRMNFLKFALSQPTLEGIQKIARLGCESNPLDPLCAL